MRKPLATAAFAAALIVAMGGAASAGEITGNGKPTPINGGRAGSICSFSGQNDDPTGGGDPFQDGRVQNWGHVVADAKVFIGDGDHGAGEIARCSRPRGRARTAGASPAAARKRADPRAVEAGGRPAAVARASSTLAPRCRGVLATLSQPVHTIRVCGGTSQPE